MRQPFESRLATRRASTHRPDPLEQIAALSQNARATWFGLLGVLGFTGVTLLGHTDADFFAMGAQTALPLVDLSVSVKAFFTVAPPVVAIVFAYLHLYLPSLWDALADAPARPGGVPLADRVYPWLINHAALWYRHHRRADGSAAPRALGRVVLAVSIVFGWLAGLVVLGGLWWRSMPAHDEWLTLWIAACFWAALTIGLTSLLHARDRLAGATRATAAATNWPRRCVGLMLALLIAAISWETTESGRFIPLAPIDLREAHLTRQPVDWQPFALWREAFEADWRRREGLPLSGPLPLSTDERAAFDAELWDRWALHTSALDAPDLRGADLRGADLAGAFLAGADLRHARLNEATLVFANLAGARLANAVLDDADFVNVDAQGANLNLVKAERARFAVARMNNVTLHGATVTDTNFRGATLDEASLDRTVFMTSRFDNASLQRVDLRDAIMLGVSLMNANLRGARLSGASLKGTILHGADLRNIMHEGTDSALGIADRLTRMPMPSGGAPPFALSSCWVEIPPAAQLLFMLNDDLGNDAPERWLCKPGTEPVRITAQ